MTTKPNSLTLAEWLKTAENQLRRAGIATARLDCLVLLEDLLRTDRTQLLAHSEQSLSTEHLKVLNAWVLRRQNHEPLAYIRSKTEFYGREFVVSPDTLEPRPETETMIELLKQLVDSKQMTDDSNTTILDIGTGSGCIAISVKLELPSCNVFATDVSSACLEIANKNAQILRAEIHFEQSDLLSTVTCKPSAILANLPYVPDAHTINRAAMQEPAVAIFGGPDGLELYRKLFQQLPKIQPKWVLTESLPFQHNDLAEIAEKIGYRLHHTEDFIQVFSA